MDTKKIISSELNLHQEQIGNVISLLDSDATIPFIARYRKDVTKNLDEIAIKKIKERYEYLKELEERKSTILNSIDAQGKLTDELGKKIKECLEKSKIEDLYLPFKPKRRSKATIAREQGVEPLLLWILTQKNPNTNIELKAAEYIDKNKKIESVHDALNGASDIYAEMIAEKAEIRNFIRKWFYTKGIFTSKVRKAYEGKKTKYEMYYNFSSPVKNISSHNMLGMRRAEKNGITLFDIAIETEQLLEVIYKKEIHIYYGPVYNFLKNSITDAYNRLIKNSIIAEIRLEKKKDADLGAILTFEKNLRNLLLSPPAGHVPVLAIDPGFRNGCKIVALDSTGMFKEYKAIYPHPPQQKKEKAAAIIFDLIKKYSPEYIAIGNGTGARETERFIKMSLKKYSTDNKPKVLLVNEAGASVYSASESAADEFPDLDVLIRGAISIGRRLTDPLSELVKIDPKSIGVGQYQHDVDQKLLKNKLSDVVESSVNYVGVDLNSASIELLSYVSGISQVIAKNILKHREKTGPFKNRKELLNVSRLGEKTFEQASGFLRIKGGDNPLDNSAVHPESYHIVDKILKDINIPVDELIGNSDVIDEINPSKFVNEKSGEITIKDILEELKKPGRDPRTGFTYANFNEEVNSIEDLNIGMKLEGVITNVANFGAFVDIGVHTDGLVHISQITNGFIKDPNDIVKVGQNVKVKVLKVDQELKRISLSMKG